MNSITIGQFFPGETFVHKLDPRMKLVLTTVYIVMLFLAGNIWALLVSVVFLMIAYPLSRLSGRMVIRSVRPIFIIITITAVLNMFFVGGNVLWSWWRFAITDQGIYNAVMIVLRIVSLVVGTSLLTYTTSPIALTDAIERLLNPLKKLKMPVHELAMMMTIALRFIPTLMEETEKIMSAQKARGADMESGNLMQRIKALIPILVPLFVAAFRRADELALAMECRCYHGGEGRTRMTILTMSWRDWTAALFMAVLLAAVVYLNTIPGWSMH
jgi:ABC-type cobalt transport system, permease component CbiQ and related transporters